ncbi:transmembrane anchor protein [Roseinatronobacter sp. S2]|uniref:transmembrane anchor protein n=1 Tax=Roseinatronobacter sp. S2 TaxID=3035471 RepID=UPI00240EC960|nr:transmembrane anchor protein [Roseinatronobacter sp. S2]WFE77297.1 transmembrane anchor protein [Roseinatronobacter sp. S2]
MNNAPKPNLDELPTKAQLFRSSVIASIGAVAILVTVYLPAEYAIDPTGVGRVLGLTEMGEIKMELAAEAEADRLLDEQLGQDQSSSVLDTVFGLFVGAAHAQQAPEALEAWRDEVTFTLEPGATAEIKMTMESGNTVNYAWSGTGGRVNFDLHAHGGGESVTYERGRGQTAGEGSIEAPFTGDHGWFWRNRDSTPITITIQLRGEYSEVVETY